MTAAEILAVSGAKAYWGTIAEVEAYLLYMEQVLQEDVGEIAGNIMIMCAKNGRMLTMTRTGTGKGMKTRCVPWLVL